MASVILLHTCESESSAKQNAAYLLSTGNAPHIVFDPRFPIDEQIRLIPFDQRAKALANLPGGVETNNRESDGDASVDVIQVELVGYASRVAGYDDAWYRNLRIFLLNLCAETGVEFTFPKRFAQDYGDARRVRLSGDEWLATRGILGHCHVPENDHWDPGALDLARLAPPAPIVPIPEDPDMLRLLVVDDPAGAQLMFTGDTVAWIANGNAAAMIERASVKTVRCTVAEVQGLLKSIPAVGPSPSTAGSAVSW